MRLAASSCAPNQRTNVPPSTFSTFSFLLSTSYLFPVPRVGKQRSAISAEERQLDVIIVTEMVVFLSLVTVTRHFCREAPIPHSFPVFNLRLCRSVHRLELETTTLAARWTLFLSSR